MILIEKLWKQELIFYLYDFIFFVSTIVSIEARQSETRSLISFQEDNFLLLTLRLGQILYSSLRTKNYLQFHFSANKTFMSRANNPLFFSFDVFCQILFVRSANSNETTGTTDLMT